MNDSTFDRIYIDVARQDAVAGYRDTTTTVRRSTGMTLADRAALTAAIVELLDELIDGVDFEPPADGNGQRHKWTIMATDDAIHARDAARLSAAAFTRAASL